VRRAFVQAIDREHFADVVLNGFSFPGTGGMIPPGMLAHSPEAGLPYSPDQGAGAAGRGRLSRRARLPGGRVPGRRRSAGPGGVLFRQWRRNLGVDTLPQALDWEAFSARLEDDPPQLFIDNWICDYPDPDNVLRAGLRCAGPAGRTLPINRWWRLPARPPTRRSAWRCTARPKSAWWRPLPWRHFRYLRTHLLIRPCVARFPTSPVAWWYWKDVVMGA